MAIFVDEVHMREIETEMLNELFNRITKEVLFHISNRVRNELSSVLTLEDHIDFFFDEGLTCVNYDLILSEWFNMFDCYVSIQGRILNVFWNMQMFNFDMYSTIIFDRVKDIYLK